MKSFLQFLSESKAVQQATRMGLTGDGHGGWYDKNGEFVAKTEKGVLKFYNKRQKIGQQDPPQSDREKNLSHTTSAQSQQQVEPQQPVSQKDDPEGPVEPDKLTPPQVEKTKGTLTIAFGRFNPPTTGHEKLLDTVASSSDDGDYVIVPSRSQDNKKNPLDADQKVSVMRQMFPNHSEKIVNDPANKTIFDVLKKAHNDGYTNVRLVVGADRQKEFDKLTNNYNGLQYDFDQVEVRSAGNRDPDGEGVEGMSASKQRKYAAENDFDNFLKGVPTAMNRKLAKDLFNNIRAGMNIKEGWNLWEIAPIFDWKNLRENYVNKNIYKVGQLVENLNTGFIGKIIRRGANYLICVTEDKIMFKSWIKDVTEAVVNGTTKSGVPAHQREVGTDSLLNYTKSMVPGSEWGKHFINKYRKK
jgi:nicotinic acid mononucleotide adenylyltransferase